jgi:hypothetical protein
LLELIDPGCARGGGVVGDDGIFGGSSLHPLFGHLPGLSAISGAASGYFPFSLLLGQMPG